MSLNGLTVIAGLTWQDPAWYAYVSVTLLTFFIKYLILIFVDNESMMLLPIFVIFHINII